MLVRQDFAQVMKRKWGENLSLFKKLLGIGNYWSHHWKLHVNSFYWALDHPRFLLSHQRLVLLSLLPDMKSCRALTLHFVWYPKKNKWDKSEQSGISNFSAHRTDWPFRLRPASKPGCAAMCMCWSPKLQFSSSWSFSHFMLDLQPAMVDVSSTFVAFTTPLNLAPHRWQTPYCSKGRALNPWTWFCTSLPLLSFVFAGSDINLVAKNYGDKESLALYSHHNLAPKVSQDLNQPSLSVLILYQR